MPTIITTDFQFAEVFRKQIRVSAFMGNEKIGEGIILEITDKIIRLSDGFYFREYTKFIAYEPLTN